MSNGDSTSDHDIGFSLTAEDSPTLARALEVWNRIPEADREILIHLFRSKAKNPTAQNGHRYRGTRLPETFQPPEEWIAWATQLGVTRGRALQHFAQFRDYWAAVPGKEGVKLSWFATWKNRCRSLADAGRL